MTPRQIRLLHRSFASIQPLADVVGMTFYERLFECAPQIRSMFNDDIGLQQRKLMNFFGEFVKLNMRSLLTLPVTAASDPEVSIPGIASLAQRHTRYGVKPEHFVAAKEALFWSFQKHLSGQLDGETMLAWSAAFDMIAESMIRVMREHATDPVLPQWRKAPEWEVSYDAVEETLFRE